MDRVLPQSELALHRPDTCPAVACPHEAACPARGCVCPPCACIACRRRTAKAQAAIVGRGLLKRTEPTQPARLF